MRSAVGGVVWGFVLAIGCAKPATPTAVRAAPVHPDLACPAGTVANGTAPPNGDEAWCELRAPDRPPMRQGPSLTWHDNGAKASQGSFASGFRTGPWLFWHANGELSEQGPFVSGVREGIWTTWDATGARTSEGAYAGGKRDGAWTFWTPADQTRTEGRYALGKRQGEWTEYSPEGTAVRARTFRNDRQIDQRELR